MYDYMNNLIESNGLVDINVDWSVDEWLLSYDAGDHGGCLMDSDFYSAEDCAMFIAMKFVLPFENRKIQMTTDFGDLKPEDIQRLKLSHTYQISVIKN